MIAVARAPSDPGLHPTRLAVGLTRPELTRLRSGRRMALDGGTLGQGLNGLGFLFLSARDEAQVRERFGTLIERMSPDAPADYTFPVMGFEGKLWHAPVVPVGREEHASGTAHLVAYSRLGLASLARGDTISLQARVLSPAVATTLLPSGADRAIRPLAMADRVIDRAARGGDGLRAGSFFLSVRVLADEQRAVRWAREDMGLSPAAAPVAGVAAEVRIGDPPDWLPQWRRAQNQPE